MKKIKLITLISLIGFCIALHAKPETDGDRITRIEAACTALKVQQTKTNAKLQKLITKNKANEATLSSLNTENKELRSKVDSLKNECSSLSAVQSADRTSINGKLDITNKNQDTLKNNAILIVTVLLLLICTVIAIVFWLIKRMKKGTDSIDKVKQAQDALETAQQKMQEESIKLDDKLLELMDKQIAASQQNNDSKKPDHSLALKVADEIARIKLNMSRMDSSIKGYKQLAKAVERIKDNFKANGYEIVDMLGMPYNEGMKVVANFVVDENLEEGKQIITGITKPQVNYNGQMIQSAQITVSQNI